VSGPLITNLNKGKTYHNAACGLKGGECSEGLNQNATGRTRGIFFTVNFLIRDVNIKLGEEKKKKEKTWIDGRFDLRL